MKGCFFVEYDIVMMIGDFGWYCVDVVKFDIVVLIKCVCKDYYEWM